MAQRPALSQLGLSTGKRARLHRILHKHGVGNGTAIFLPYDQGLEHGPRDFFENPVSADPRYIVKLAVEGAFNGVALQVGNAEKFYWEFAGEVPLVLKINGKTEVPSDAEALSPLNASVADAVRLGADAVGYTLYVGSPLQAQDFEQFRQVRSDCDTWGMPLIVWAYPRGSYVDEAGGKNSLYMVDYAARTAAELGADIVKVNFPDPTKTKGVKKEYTAREWTSQAAVDQVVSSACHSLVLLSGGEKAGEEGMIEKARESMEAGACGLIFGRNIWQREHDEALRFVDKLKDVLAKYPSNP